MEYPALAVNPPQDQTPNMLGMIAAMQQGQLRKQQIQAANLENQQREQAVKDQQTILGLYQKHQGDLDKVIADAPAAGVTPNSIQALQQHQLQVKTQTADLVAKQGAEAARQADLMVGAHDAIDKAPADEKPVVYQQQLASLQKQGVDVSQLPPQYPGDDQFKMLGIVARSHSKNVEDALKASEQEKNAQQAAAAKAQAAKTNTEINPDNPADPNIQKQKYQSILENLQKPGGLKNISAADYQWARAFEASQAKTTTQADSLGVTSTNTSKPSGLATVGGNVSAPTAAPQGGGTPGAPNPNTPSGKVSSIIDAVGQYKYNPTLLNRLLTKHPEILGQVAQKYPDFSQSNYNAINKAITDLAPSGKTGQQITSYNTFLRHAGALYDAVDSLNNSKYSDLLNKPMNWLAQHTGDPRVADFMAAMQPPMKEFQAFLLNNHAMHDEDVKDAHDLISLDKTPQEIRAVLKRFAETGSARLSEQNESFKRITGKDIPNLVSPEAAKAYNKITGNGGQGGGNVAPEGTIVQTPKGKMIKRGGQWVAY